MPTLTADISVFTYEDAVNRLLGYCNLNGQTNAVEAVNQAVLGMYDTIALGRNWSYLNRQYRIPIVETVTGTCSYSSSTGEFTIDGADTWPTWAERNLIDIAGVKHTIKTRTSSTVLLADDTVRPQSDVVTGTAFTMYRCVFQLPVDFRRMYRPIGQTDDPWVEPVTFSGWLENLRYGGEGSPNGFSIAADPYEPVRQVLLLSPYDTIDDVADLAYQRYPRPLTYNGKESHCRAGTITAAGTSVTGSASPATQFEAGMVGAILRISRDPTNKHPSGRGSVDAYKQQVYIKTYAAASGAAAITLHESMTVTTGKYTISDPLDLDRPLMDAFWRGCEWKLSQSLRFPKAELVERDFRTAMRIAGGDDQKTNVRRSAWDRAGPGRSQGNYATIINTDPDPDE